MSVLTPHLYPTGFFGIIRRKQYPLLNKFTPPPSRPTPEIHPRLNLNTNQNHKHFSYFPPTWRNTEPNLSAATKEWNLKLPAAGTPIFHSFPTVGKDENFPSLRKWYFPSGFARTGCFHMARWNCKHPGVIISKSILFWIREGDWVPVNNNTITTSWGPASPIRGFYFKSATCFSWDRGEHVTVDGELSAVTEAVQSVRVYRMSLDLISLCPY